MSDYNNMEEAIKLIEAIEAIPDKRPALKDNILKIYAVLGNKAVADLESLFKRAHETLDRKDDTIRELEPYHPLF